MIKSLTKNSLFLTMLLIFSPLTAIGTEKQNLAAAPESSPKEQQKISYLNFSTRLGEETVGGIPI